MDRRRLTDCTSRRRRLSCSSTAPTSTRCSTRLWGLSCLSCPSRCRSRRALPACSAARPRPLPRRPRSGRAPCSARASAAPPRRPPRRRLIPSSMPPSIASMCSSSHPLCRPPPGAPTAARSAAAPQTKTRAQRAPAARSAAAGGGQQVRKFKRHFRFRTFAKIFKIRYKS
ncbi:hypothetical protein EMIHUDRAFT_444550, partial [Emiliania huxleyi CCMP1516]|uniref:Uncharacterized protein n=2 Tax=Emiliania huxleyi TaxID=2903 RepID=A0A0D3JA25_EMIH1